MGLEIFSLQKKVGGALFSLIADNNLFHMKTPKILFTVIQPAQDNSGKYNYEKAFLDVKEVEQLIRGIKFYNSSSSPEIIKSFKGGMDTKLNKIVSRVFKVEIKGNYVIFSIELAEGVQSYTQNKYGQKVAGVVKPASGKSTIRKGSIGLNVNEAMYIVEMLDKELTAWRTSLNIDFMYHPEKYRFKNKNNNNNQNQQSYNINQNNNTNYNY